MHIRCSGCTCSCLVLFLSFIHLTKSSFNNFVYLHYVYFMFFSNNTQFHEDINYHEIVTIKPNCWLSKAYILVFDKGLVMIM